MDLRNLLKSYFLKRRSLIIKGIESAKIARDEAPSAMESHSDTTRSQNEKMLEALVSELNLLDSFLERISKRVESRETKPTINEWTYVETKLGDNKVKLFIIPDGLGGEVIQDTRLISSQTPIGKILLGKTEKAPFILNGQKGKILKINKY